MFSVLVVSCAFESTEMHGNGERPETSLSDLGVFHARKSPWSIVLIKMLFCKSDHKFTCGLHNMLLLVYDCEV